MCQETPPQLSGIYLHILLMAWNAKACLFFFYFNLRYFRWLFYMKKDFLQKTACVVIGTKLLWHFVCNFQLHGYTWFLLLMQSWLYWNSHSDTLTEWPVSLSILFYVLSAKNSHKQMLNSNHAPVSGFLCNIGNARVVWVQYSNIEVVVMSLYHKNIFQANV